MNAYPVVLKSLKSEFHRMNFGISWANLKVDVWKDGLAVLCHIFIITDRMNRAVEMLNQ